MRKWKLLLDEEIESHGKTSSDFSRQIMSLNDEKYKLEFKLKQVEISTPGEEELQSSLIEI